MVHLNEVHMLERLLVLLVLVCLLLGAWKDLHTYLCMTLATKKADNIRKFVVAGTFIETYSQIRSPSFCALCSERGKTWTVTYV